MSRASPCTPLFEPDELAFAGAVARLRVTNPFLPARAEAELDALGAGAGDGPDDRAARLLARVDALVHRLRDRLASGCTARADELALYQSVCLHFLQARQDGALQALVEGQASPGPLYADHLRAYDRLFCFPGAPSSPPPAPHLFAVHFQMRRALHHVASSLVGVSAPAAALRAEVWCSIFTRDLDRYVRVLYARLGAIHLLVTGPTGTGKELVARAVAFSRYVPFDPDKLRFAADPAGDFHPVNLSALSPTLIESELFGHGRGAFTGAVSEHKGWLETCGPGGTVFLDEIGELVPAVQVKLLRVLQEGTFTRSGETTERRFAGKIIAATHRDLHALVARGTFRRDLFYRLIGDRIRTPSLRDQLLSAPGHLRPLLRHLAEKVAGPAEAEALTDQVDTWIQAHLPPDYPWPGNIRELEQCVSSVMIRGYYLPDGGPRRRSAWTVETGSFGEPSTPGESSPDRGEGDASPGDGEAPPSSGAAGEGAPSSRGEEARFMRAFLNGQLTAEAALSRLATIVHAQTGNYRETGRRLQMDWRTAQRRVDPVLLARLVGKWRPGSGRTGGSGR